MQGLCKGISPQDMALYILELPLIFVYNPIYGYVRNYMELWNHNASNSHVELVC